MNTESLSNCGCELPSRRQLLQSATCGFGGMAMLDLLAREGKAAPALEKMHHAPKAKRVIFLFMHGGPSQVDTFDYKPQLQKDDGKSLPFEAAKNIDAVSKLMKSPWKFSRHGESGLWASELFPEVAKQIDDLCIIKSMHSKGQSHGQAVSMLHTGSDSLIRPSVGSWVSYGLGNENENLPAFMAISPPTAHGGPRNYGSAFLPAKHQATTLGRAGSLGSGRINNTHNKLMDSQEQRQHLNLIQQLNQNHLKSVGQGPDIEGAIEAFELAYRMQTIAPEVLDIDHETPDTYKRYGIDEKVTSNFGKQCLMARRLAESGVRYIQISTGNVWDQHGNLKSGHEKNALNVDKPIAGLIQDLKLRGLLDETLVVWGGEFGRTPIVQGKNGRDHNPQGFCMWMAGGGVKGGIAFGESDDYGYYAARDRVHMHDLHATILHLMGIDHERLTYRYAGRDFRLTDVHGRVVHEIIA
ncbi:DUF1501 domain-containing protein [Rubinisphaera italica]|uniref:Sulfatase n=1 Tax=Rubinisphaera italica TaxID=2527969 RepID=A0A5C5XM43_9PLAN|nr:DUF1501 domain-containing protein [Rubinisphaera italica]TWT63629.1 hypothetical protein Pan54_43830 [Rubinisphaera italica]